MRVERLNKNTGEPELLTAGQVDYVISYRESTPDRKKALYFVTRWIHRAFPRMNIVVVEQDKKQKLNRAELPFCQHVFVYNGGLFNRGWSNNVGARLTKNRHLIFGDADVFMSKSGYTQCLNYLRDFEAVDPKKFYINNIETVNPKTLEYDGVQPRYGNTFAGGIFLIQRKSFLSVGMWDENFEGWGGEDNVMEHVIRSYLKHCRLQLDVFHIDHHRTSLDCKRQPQYPYNSERSRHICSLHGKPLLHYVDYKKKRNLGCVDKYLVQIPGTDTTVTNMNAVTDINCEC